MEDGSLTDCMIFSLSRGLTTVREAAPAHPPATHPAKSVSLDIQQPQIHPLTNKIRSHLRTHNPQQWSTRRCFHNCCPGSVISRGYSGARTRGGCCCVISSASHGCWWIEIASIKDSKSKSCFLSSNWVWTLEINESLFGLIPSVSPCWTRESIRRGR